MGALQQATRTVPIVLANVTDPVGAGFVDSLARPGGNVTGFLSFEYGMGGKWLGLLKQIAPGVTRVAVIRDPAISAGTGQFGAIQSVAPTSRALGFVLCTQQYQGESAMARVTFSYQQDDGEWQEMMNVDATAVVPDEAELLSNDPNYSHVTEFVRVHAGPDQLAGHVERPVPKNERQWSIVWTTDGIETHRIERAMAISSEAGAEHFVLRASTNPV